MPDYGWMDRMLHRAALQLRPVAELSFEVDQKTARVDPDAIRSVQHVFVSGLARSGTTVLMRRLHATGEFCSLTYRSMPFVLAPNVWKRLNASTAPAKGPKERAHGDRIFVDIDSPESLDEVFWRVFDREGYIAPHHLTPHEPDDSTTGKYIGYVAAILHASGRDDVRYLSKNNNNILRLGAIRRAFPQAVLLVPFREPVSHAASLLRQHGNFVARQAEDGFVRSYMSWLGHYEFGLEHRPFRFDGEGADRLADLCPEHLDYWIEIWCQAYAWIEKTMPRDAVLVCYEDLCEIPEVWSRIEEMCGAQGVSADHEPFVMPRTETDTPPRTGRVQEAKALYERLVNRSRHALLGTSDPTEQKNAPRFTAK